MHRQNICVERESNVWIERSTRTQTKRDDNLQAMQRPKTVASDGEETGLKAGSQPIGTCLCACQLPCPRGSHQIAPLAPFIAPLAPVRLELSELLKTGSRSPLR